ncbi:AraC family transcriptional regulator [Bosea sp. PAMC 26642]|uniref:AraC family transcriptional regulator n=1 Tax=Bosea sp. (strain PAMC 26642) TaxID=1792307 RepID=UPI0007705FC8|nr:AraC family transcriptional regulator [Bosea sp. PAMC 26642]AMJ61003.1 transcriptional regulator [Bosea sp. PAMC 26642]
MPRALPASHDPKQEASGFFGRRIADHLEMPGDQIVDFRPQGELALAVTRLSCARQRRERTAPVAMEAAFSILHQLDDLDRHSCWLGGRQRYSDAFGAGTVSVIDLRDGPQCEFGGQFDALQFYVPAQALNDIADQHGAPAISTLRWKRDVPDSIVTGLSHALIQATAEPGANSLLVDQLSLSLLTHFAESYGGLRRIRLPENGGLAMWQERRAREIMQARLSSELTIAQVAQECRLTPSHFARAFRRSMGLAPHRYLMELRVDEAKRLLAQPHLPLADIALICGFGDQSHFTRVFRQVTGASPGAWRRAREVG